MLIMFSSHLLQCRYTYSFFELYRYHTIDSLLSAEDLKLLPLPRSVKTLEGSTLEISLQNKVRTREILHYTTLEIPTRTHVHRHTYRLDIHELLYSL